MGISYNFLDIEKWENESMKQYLLRHKVASLVVVLLSFLENAASIISISLNAPAFNALVKGDFSTFLMWKLVGIAFSGVYLASLYGYNVQLNKLIQKISIEIRGEIADRIGRANYSTVTEKDVSAYVSWFTSDLEQLEDNGFAVLFNSIGSGMMLIFALISLSLFHWGLAVVTVLVALMLFFTPKWFQKQTKEATSNLSAANEEFTTTVQNLFKGFEVFYTSNAVGQFVKRIKVASDALSEVKVSYRKKFSFVQLCISLLNFIGKISVDVVAGIMVFAGMISVGAFTAAGSLTFNCFASLEQVVQQLVQLKSIHVYFDKFNSLEADSNLQPDNSSLQQTLSLRDVTVSVNGHVIVQPVTFTIEKGKKYALLGDSGTGKSTLLNFLAGRNHEFTGEVILDGKSLSKEQIVQLRNITAYNPQKNHIFNATVKDNITLWEDSPFEEESRQMGLDQFTNAQEVVSEHGTKLSGGQRQRLALARTLLESDKVLLLDESTANLDLESARSIEVQLLQNPNLTLVIVTHHFFEEHRDLFDEVIYLGKEKSL